MPHGAGLIQLWGGGDIGLDAPPALVVLRLLGAQGRAELATEDPANRLSGVGSAVWTLNPPGYGASSGPTTVRKYLSAAFAAYDYLAARYPRARMWVYGKSIGATAAIYLVAHRDLSGVILKNAIDVPAIARRRVTRWLPARIGSWIAASVPSELSPTLWAPSGRCPALFVVSADDKVAPSDLQLHIAGLYGGPTVVLRVQGGHDDRTLHAEDEVLYAEAVRALAAPSG